jgi:hypothetical protein
MFAMGFTPEGWATAAAAPNSMTRDHDRSAADLIVESPAMMPITAAVRLLAPPKETWKECRRSGLMPVVGGGATWKRSFLSRGSCSDTFSPTELPAARSVILRFPSVTSARALWPGLSTSELMMLIDYCGGVSVPSVISAINFLPCALTEAAR